MMRTTQHPLALLVDAAAEEWLQAETLPKTRREAVRQHIAQRFNIGEHVEMTFHGLQYQLTIERLKKYRQTSNKIRISAHLIAQNN